MSVAGVSCAGLAFLPNFLNECRDALALDALLSGWVRTSGWLRAGLIAAADGSHELMMTAKSDGCDPLPRMPQEAAALVESLKGSTTTVHWPMPNSAGRLYAQLLPAGRSPGLVWVEKDGVAAWTDAERAYLKLSAKLIERAPALLAEYGPTIEPERIQQRLHDAGVIAGRMAHDFDNVLTGIIGFSDLSLPLVPAGSQPAKWLAEIGKVGQRGIVFTKQLHELNRCGQAKPQPGSLTAALAREEAKVRAAAGVQITSRFTAGLPSVAMDGGPLGNVLAHLLANAAEAMPNGGRITVVADAMDLSTAETRPYLGAVQPGSHVLVTIHDTGIGIKPEAKARLFAEPFYTTKVGRRGLGLAIVARTLTAHRGGIRIESSVAPESGTTVRFAIPTAAVPSPIVQTLTGSTLIGG